MLLKCSDGSLLAHVMSDMPDTIKKSLLRNVRNAFVARANDAAILRDRDSKSDPKGLVFPALHFSFYARSGTSVSEISFNHMYLTSAVGRRGTCGC